MTSKMECLSLAPFCKENLPQGSSKTLQDAFKTAQDEPKTLQEAFKSRQER